MGYRTCCVEATLALLTPFPAPLANAAARAYVKRELLQSRIPT